MEVRNCRSCKRLFNYIGGAPICANCKAELEKKFTEVKRYIEENKNATVPQVSEAMDVSVRQITQWVREERLSFSEDSAVTIGCESCGGPIRTGRYCNNCRTEMSKNLGSIYKTTVTSPTRDKRELAKMRYLDM